jgi:hypothetical protein
MRGFLARQVVEAHFRLLRRRVMAQTRQWLEATSDAKDRARMAAAIVELHAELEKL